MLVTVTFWPALVVFKTCALKVRLEGVIDIAEVAPMPERATDCGLVPASSVIVSVAVRVPVVDGVKNTLMVHVP